MQIKKYSNKELMGREAAHTGAEKIRTAINSKDSASIILATGVSQFELLEHLVKEDIDWSNVTGFHLDEYIDIDETHPASFRKYLKERFVNKVKIKQFHFINGNNVPEKECSRLGEIISDHKIDVAFIGIGENGHLAFNDPPADFETEQPYIIANLDEICRMQQLGEGWFPNLENVPNKAISMSIKQILKSKTIICTVPDERKARVVSRTLNEEISPLIPATILKTHSDTFLFLDEGSASLINNKG
ncbi:MAG: glucosamine-6-phosphate deaminase [Ignavibacterium sp.]|nr:MAG: glucosamine-6-phosphate deaminase [Ignavibacterium sp.]